MNKNLIDIFDFLDAKDKKCAENIYYGLELFANSLDDGIVSINAEMKELLDNRDFSQVKILTNYCEKLTDIQNSANEYLDEFASEKIEEEPVEPVKSNDIDYSIFEVDHNVPHSLNEDFEHKKICAFLINGKKYNASNWQDALVKLCSIFSETDANAFNRLVTDSKFKGRKVVYFGLESVERRNRLIPHTNVYVWINLSANSIKKLMRKILVEFGIQPSSFSVFFRADLSPLHNDYEEDLDATDDVLKIGKYVRNEMKNLENADYQFSEAMIESLLDKDKTKQLIGINNPFFKEIHLEDDLRTVTKDIQGRPRYWKDIFTFNNRHFLISSQWFEYNRNDFNRWLACIK